jgi:CDP-paratose 2-epimerase
VGDTTWNLERLRATTHEFTHYDLDIRNRPALEELFAASKFDVVVHCAAQPSHDKARDIPLIDFEVNALGTLHLLEATRHASPDAIFIFISPDLSLRSGG